MSAALVNSAMAAKLEKVGFHSSPKERRCQRMFKLSNISFHMLARLVSKYYMSGFHSTWTKNFQVYKLGLEKTEEPKIKLPMFIDKHRDHRENKITPEEYLLLLHWLCLSLWLVDHNKQWKILKEMGVPDHLTCLLRNLYAGQKATVRTLHRTTDCFKIGRGVQQVCMFSPYLFNL